MSFANFGIGLGAFTQGFASGAQTGAQLRGLKDQGDIRRQAKKGMTAAKGQREADISGRIERTGLDNRQDFMGEVTTGYKVGDTTYGSEQAARPQAEKGVGNVMDYFMQDAAPRIAETYMAQGDPEKAQAWQTFIQDRNTQQGMTHWAGAMRAAQMGDMEGFATALEAAYNTPGYMDDGVKATGHEIGKDGSITMTFERDGKTFTQTFEGSDDVVQAGIGLLSPQAAFETSLAQSQAAAEARNKAALEENKFNQNLARDTHQQNLKDRSALLEEGAKEERAIATLRQWDYSDEEIRKMIPRIIGASTTRAEISDTDLRKSIMETLAVSDRRWRNLDNAGREKLIDEMVEVIRGGEAPAQGRPEAKGLGSDTYPMYP